MGQNKKACTKSGEQIELKIFLIELNVQENAYTFLLLRLGDGERSALIFFLARIRAPSCAFVILPKTRLRPQLYQIGVGFRYFDRSRTFDYTLAIYCCCKLDWFCCTLNCKSVVDD